MDATNRLLAQREASREAGDLLARAVVQATGRATDTPLAAAAYAYMKREACVEATFFATMSAKERLVVGLIRFLRNGFLVRHP
jgi:hypothetical protein